MVQRIISREDADMYREVSLAGHVYLVNGDDVADISLGEGPGPSVVYEKLSVSSEGIHTQEVRGSNLLQIVAKLKRDHMGCSERRAIRTSLTPRQANKLGMTCS